MENTKQIDILLLVFGGSLIILGIGAVLLAFFFIGKRKEYRRRLQQQQTETAHQQELLYKNIETQERERRRIAQDLHDEIGTLLSVMRMNVVQIEWNAHNGPLLQQFTVATKALIDRVMENTRSISHSLLPASLEMIGLCNTLENFCNAVKEASGIDVLLNTPASIPETDSNTELGLYRICSELVNNSIKHSKCSLILLSISLNGNTLHLHYKDNGIGFNADAALAKAGLGLKNIMSRAQMLNATVEFQTAPGAGLEVWLKLQLQNKQTYGKS